MTGSSNDDRRDIQGEGDERAEDIAIDEAVDNGAASGGMDFDVVESNIIDGITLASGRKCNR